MAWRRLQTVAMAALALTAVCFTYFLLDVYMKRVSDRWSQKPIIATYYKKGGRPTSGCGLADVLAGREFLHAERIYEGPKEKRTIFLVTATPKT